MRKIIFISGLLFFLSCKEKTIPKESNCTFQLPQKEIFIKTSKLQGGKFVIYFASDSLSLNNSKDSIEYRTGAYPQVIVDTTDIYVDAKKLHGTILNIGKNHFNIVEVVSDSVFYSFFENDIQKYPYSFISIDTREYSIYVNQEKIKKGDIHGGW